ncbi:MAG: helix-turn-helix domain-containing protein [Xanthomonadales bacterium]|nr:helix-turn-helix domain-containing protein [Xanthomonadales bacterium]
MFEQTKAEPLAIGVDEAALIVGIGRTRMFQMIAKGVIPAFKIGRSRLIRMADLRAFVDRAARGEVR